MNAYPTKAALIAALDASSIVPMSGGRWYMPGTYYTAHGEYERPDYTPRRYRDGWSLHASYYYYAGTLYARQDGRVDADTLADLLA